MRSSDGRRVLFVGDPELVPPDQMDASLDFARPDDKSDTGRSWREELIRYNDDPYSNPLGLLPAWRIYRNPVYASLEEKFGVDRLFILSAGWGLIRSDFLTPMYDITFNSQANLFKRRHKSAQFNDFRMLPADINEPVLFFVEADYIPLACRLTDGVRTRRHLFHDSRDIPTAPGFITESYENQTEDQWHYMCAKDFIDGKIALSTGS